MFIAYTHPDIQQIKKRTLYQMCGSKSKTILFFSNYYMTNLNIYDKRKSYLLLKKTYIIANVWFEK